MKVRQFLCITILGALVLACNGMSNGPIINDGEGFKPFPSARSFDKPGRIYRVDRQGNVYKVAFLDLEPQKGEEVLPRVSAKTEFSLQQIINTVGLNPIGISGNLSNEFQKKREFVTESVNGQRAFLDDTQVDPVLKKTFDNLMVRPNNKYFLIRETILSDRLKYTSGKSVFANASMKAEFKKLVEAESSVKWEDSEEFSLDKTFSSPLNIWYKPERILFKKTSRGALTPEGTEKKENDFVIPGEVPLEP